MKAVAALVVLALIALPACRRVDRGATARAKAEIAGAWVRERSDGSPGVEGFDLRADGGVGLLGIHSRNGIAWNVTRDELVISTNTDRHARPNPSRLRIASHDPDTLSLRADPPDFFAGSYRRSPVEHVSGVVTYLEQMPLPPDARVEVRLRRGERLLARTLITPRGTVPIPFALSLLPEPDQGANGFTLEAGIASGAGPLFASETSLSVQIGATDVELLVRRTPAPQ
jgi:uncharacterized lipoprotein YbaY